MTDEQLIDQFLSTCPLRVRAPEELLARVYQQAQAAAASSLPWTIVGKVSALLVAFAITAIAGAGGWLWLRQLTQPEGPRNEGVLSGYVNLGGGYWAPAWSPDGKWIAATHFRQFLVPGEKAIRVFDAATGARRAEFKTRGDEVGLSPQWLPDSSGLAFVPQVEPYNKIVVARLADRSRRSIIHPRHRSGEAISVSEPSISPDGRLLAYTGGGGNIFVVGHDGGNRRRIWPGKGKAGGVLAWSADSRTLWYVSRDKWWDGSWGPPDLRLAKVDIRTLAEVTVPTPFLQPREAQGLVLSPDRDRVAWVTLGLKRDALYVAALAPGAQARELLSTSGSTGHIGLPEHRWSPDGTCLAVGVGRLHSHEAYDARASAAGLYVVRFPSGEARWLVRGIVESYSWSPDSRCLVAEVWDDQGPTCRVAEVSTGKSWTISGPYKGEQPAWAPDSKRLVFVPLLPVLGKADTYDTELWTVRVDGTDLRRLAKAE